MTQTAIPLDQIGVAAPCSANWNDMTGDDRARNCGLCKLNVYNLSDMTKAEAEALIKAKQGNLCVRYFKRADGTILTKNCPLGVSAARKRLARIGAIAAGLLAFMGGGFVAAMRGNNSTGDLRNAGSLQPVKETPAVKSLVKWLDPEPQNNAVMGKMCPMPLTITPPPPAPTPAPAPAPAASASDKKEG